MSGNQGRAGWRFSCPFTFLLSSPRRRLGSIATVVPRTTRAVDSSLRWNDAGSGEGFEITTQARDCASALLRRPSGDVSRQGDCRELKQMEYGPLNIVPYQLKNKKDTPKSGPSDRCCNPFTLMMGLFWSRPCASHLPVLCVRFETCKALALQPATTPVVARRAKTGPPLDGRAGCPGGVKSGCLMFSVQA